jgi:hypothetical protein
MTTTLEDIATRLERIEAALHLIPAAGWLPVAQAADALGCPSTRALRTRIMRGTILPQHVRRQGARVVAVNVGAVLGVGR